MKRYLKSGVEIEILSSPIDITIHTKVPSKYILIDEETGQVYRGNKGGYWEKIIYSPIDTYDTNTWDIKIEEE